MKKLFFYSLFFITLSSLGQSSSELIIDNASTLFSNISFPYWLKSGQTINIGANTKTISVLEFNVDNNSLEFSQVLSINSLQTVPVNKVWKIESVGLNNTNSNLNLPNASALGGSSTNSSLIPTIYQSPKKFETPGVNNWVVPPGVTSICVEVWGAGGNGYFSGSGTNKYGGGGGYGYQCLNVIPGTSYEITVGGSTTFVIDTKFGNIITATRGTSANANSSGIGGTASSSINGIFVVNGGNGILNCGGNGGNGGGGALFNSAAEVPGGGGGITTSTVAGARGQVYIYW
jgi:hypothetical protein